MKRDQIEIKYELQTWTATMLLEALHSIPVVRFADPTAIRGRLAASIRREIAHRGLSPDLKWVGFEQARKMWMVDD